MAATKIEGLKIDITHITAREMQAFLKAAKENDYEVMAETFTTLITEFPFGDPKKVDTYLDLPYYGDSENPLSFSALIAEVAEAGKNAGKR